MALRAVRHPELLEAFEYEASSCRDTGPKDHLRQLLFDDVEDAAARGDLAASERRAILRFLRVYLDA